MNKKLYEAEIETGMDFKKLAKYAALAGLSVLAAKKLMSKYKKEKSLEKFGKNSNNKNLDMQDIIVPLGGVIPSNFGRGE